MNENDVFLFVFLILTLFYLIVFLKRKVIFPKWAKLKAKTKWNIRFLDNNNLIKRAIIFIWYSLLFFFLFLLLLVELGIKLSSKILSNKKIKI